jgi:hypothetical protein
MNSEGQTFDFSDDNIATLLRIMKFSDYIVQVIARDWWQRTGKPLLHFLRNIFLEILA